jgi:hypothetical protein
MSRFLLIPLSAVLVSGCLSSHPLATNQQIHIDKASDTAAMNVDRRVNTWRDARLTAPVTVVVPFYPVERGCKSAGAAVEGDSYDGCLKQESEAKRQLSDEWKRYPVAARAECSAADGVSYVEMLACFEVKDWMKHPDKIGGVTGTASSQQAKEENDPPSLTNNPTSVDVGHP